MYARLRVGIGRQAGLARQISDYVLGRFGTDEKDIIEKVVNQAARQVECWLTDGITKAMNQFNGAVVASMTKETQ
jgi:PTH1 family peptidyl-tRNA hydrolase